MKNKETQDVYKIIGFSPLKIIGGFILRNGKFPNAAISVTHITGFSVSTVLDYESGMYGLILTAHLVNGDKLLVYEESFLIEDVEEIGAYSEALLTNAIYQVYAKR